METSPCHWRLALHTRGRCTQRSIALLGRVAATACSLFVRGSRRSSAKEGEESYRKERERGLPACVSPVTPPTRDTCRIFSCANITCSALANIILKYRECKPERAGDEPISRYSKFLENLLRPLRSGGARGPPEAPCAAQQCGNGAPALILAHTTARLSTVK